MKLYEQIMGRVRLRISGAFPESVLNMAAMEAIALSELNSVDDCTVELSIAERDLGAMRSIAEKCMCEMEVLCARGGSRTRKLVGRRRWLIAFAAITAAILTVSSLFIWEIDVRGNESISRGEVLRALAECGVESGTFWPGLSSDMVRSEMMTKLPEIGWMALNVCGSRAVVLIQERQEKPEIYAESAAADIRAKKTGIIKRISVLNGKAEVKAGDAVTEGETLISGTMDSITNGSRYVRAKGQILAETWYELSAVRPCEEAVKDSAPISRSRFAVILGKRRINLYISSGKTIDECDKIIHEYKIGIEGLFAMPVKIVREELRHYDSESAPDTVREEMERTLREQLAKSITGEIQQISFTEGTANGLYTLTLHAHCMEQIGETVPMAQ